MICKNMSEHYIINNYSVVEYYFFVHFDWCTIYVVIILHVEK